MKITKTINHLRLFSEDYFYFKNALVIVHNSLINDFGGSGIWIRIMNNKKSIYRIVCGSGKISLQADTIELDPKSIIKLGVKNILVPLKLTLKKANIIQRIIANLTHPDVKYRISLIISLGSLMLAIIGILITIFNNR